MCLVGSSGVGKSTLVEAWLERLSRENYRDARRVYGWSFQTREPGDAAVSADPCVSDLFRWLGQEPPLRASPWERGNRLARLVRQEATLLILDGVEPLLARDGDAPATIQNPALARLLTDDQGDCRRPSSGSAADERPRERICSAQRLPERAFVRGCRALGRRLGDGARAPRTR